MIDSGILASIEIYNRTWHFDSFVKEERKYKTNLKAMLRAHYFGLFVSLKIFT